MPSLVSALVVFGVFVGICGLLVWLGEPASGDVASNLGSVLEAQAAMTAIFLAAMIFIVEAVQRREGLDDPLYELFLSKSWARWIFATAVWLLVGTALLYVLGPITGGIGELADARGDALGIVSLVVAAFLVLVFLLRALHVLRPEQYRELRRDAVLSQVRHGARSYAQSTESMEERARRILGFLNNPETQATRAIERVVDQTYQAVERAQITEIREGMEILESICKIVLEELEEGDLESSTLNDLDYGLWLGHDNILSGMQRMVRTADNRRANDSALWSIFRADVQKARTTFSTPYRLGENVDSRNELFVQVMLECVQSERKVVAKLADKDTSFRFQAPQEEMLSDALRSALYRSSAAFDNSRENRLARRMVAFIHDLASRSALERDEKQVCSLLESFLQHADDVILTEKKAPKYSDAIDRTLRQATLSAIGYGVGVGNHDFLDTTARWLKVSEHVETGEVPHLYALIDQDVSQRNSGDSSLSGGLLWLSSSMHSQPPPIETEEDLHQRQAECVILGYMWLLGIVHDGTGDVDLPDTVGYEFDRVWRIHGRRLVAALSRASAGEVRDLWSWCEAAFAVRDDGTSD